MAKKSEVRPVINGIKMPARATLLRYGITLNEYKDMLQRQYYRCPICHRKPPNMMLCVDHYHASKWKKLPACERKKFVRGLVCSPCNRWALHWWVNKECAWRLAAYLSAFEKRFVLAPSSKNNNADD